MNATATRDGPDDRAEYESTYRRSEEAIPCLLAIAVAFVVAIFAIVRFVDGRDLETAIAALVGATIVSLGAVLATVFRVHHWTVRPDGIEIGQRPRLRFAGLSRRTIVRFADIAGLYRIDSGLERQIEIATRDGRRFRLAQALVGGSAEIARPDARADLDAFARSIRDAATRAGAVLPATMEGLSFWNSGVGLALLVVLFALSLLIAGVVVVALWEGMTIGPRPRGGETLAILLLLPVGAGYLLVKSLRRRAAVRAAAVVPPSGS